MDPNAIDPVCDPNTGELYENPYRAEQAGVFDWQRQCLPGVEYIYGGYDYPWWGGGWGWGGRGGFGRRRRHHGGHGHHGGGGGGGWGGAIPRRSGGGGLTPPAPLRLLGPSGGGGAMKLAPSLLSPTSAGMRRTVSYSPSYATASKSFAPSSMVYAGAPRRTAGYGGTYRLSSRPAGMRTLRGSSVRYGGALRTGASMRSGGSMHYAGAMRSAAPMRSGGGGFARASSSHGMRGLGQYNLPIVGQVSGGALLAITAAMVYFITR